MHDKYSFEKYHSLENDFLIFEKEYFFFSDTVARLCDRKTGIGADGVICYQKNRDLDVFTFSIQNADGSGGDFSGNGSRCLAAHLFKKYNCNQVMLKTRTKEVYSFKSDVLVTTRFDFGTVLNKTGIVIDTEYFDVFYVDVGNPHLLFYENMSKEFFLKHIFIIKKQLIADQNISLIYMTVNGPFIITYERGVGFTQGCSSAALAFLTLVKSKFFIESNTSFLNAKNCTLLMPGGKLLVKYEDQFVEMSAQAFLVFEGMIKI